MSTEQPSDRQSSIAGRLILKKINGNQLTFEHDPKPYDPEFRYKQHMRRMDEDHSITISVSPHDVSHYQIGKKYFVQFYCCDDTKQREPSASDNVPFR